MGKRIYFDSRKTGLQAGKKKVTVPAEEATAKYVPAAAVIRMSQALSGIIGHKGHLGGQASLG